MYSAFSPFTRVLSLGEQGIIMTEAELSDRGVNGETFKRGPARPRGPSQWSEAENTFSDDNHERTNGPMRLHIVTKVRPSFESRRKQETCAGRARMPSWMLNYVRVPVERKSPACQHIPESSETIRRQTVKHYIDRRHATSRTGDCTYILSSSPSQVQLRDLAVSPDGEPCLKPC